ncbi:transcription factor bHLH68 isoform X1 [Arachis duranensis]|uniref:Transcription factor bHLH68 isoform X1 n=1 Tax=Arachis duranensis TaxID=130453 RepID=A0A6P4DDK9_ARADU|nr:transcription factor bHLH68 isoform X1 [Arachis duranensis]
MNRGVVHGSPVQQMMAAGNPNWWNINSMRPPPLPQAPPFLSTTPNSSNFLTQYSSSSSSLPLPPSWHENQELPESWSQLLMGGLVGEEDHHQMLSHHQGANNNASLVDVKQESSVNSYVYGHGGANEELQPSKTASWSPNSCVTSFSSNMLDFSSNNNSDHKTNIDARHPPPPPPDRSSECNSSGSGGAVKKARVQPSTTTQSTFKVRKEKLGDRITALHQLVSPFGKTDTASVLLEAIGYIRFLQSQIEALSLPYLSNGSGNTRHQQHSVHQGEKNCLFPEDPGQLLHENCLKRKAPTSEQDSKEETKKDLRSRGLCLVPVSCTLQVGSDNGADYWAPALGGGFR